MVSTPPTDIASEFANLVRDVERATYGTVLLKDCEPEHSRVLTFVEAHPESRTELAKAFCDMLPSYNHAVLYAALAVARGCRCSS